MIIILIGSSIFTWLFVQKNLVIFLKFSSCSKLNLAFDDDEFDDNVYFFCFWPKITNFCRFGPITTVFLRWNLASKLIRAWWIQWWCPFDLFWTENTLFSHAWSKKIKIVCLRRKSLSTIIYEIFETNSSFHIYPLKEKFNFYFSGDFC